MIKNKRGLVGGKLGQERKMALQIIEAGLEAANVRKAVLSAKLPAVEGYENIFAVGFGKASALMAEALEERLGSRIKNGAVISVRAAKTRRIKGLVGSHPLPSSRNVKAAGEIVEIAENAGEKDLVFALISGGGSALLALPAKPVSIGELQKTTGLLVKSRATIREINCVRKHLSAVKGGLLMKAIYPAKLYAIIVSDVVGNELDTIASGPTVPDRSTFKQAQRVLKKYGLWKKAPKSARNRITLGAKGKIAETPKPGDRIFKKAKNHIILDNLSALKAMQRKARQLGFNATIYSDRLQGEARETGKKLVRIAAEKRKPVALLAGGETTVNVKGKGQGGRNQEMVLGSLSALEKAKKAVFVSIGSDGIDGNSRAAGAVADSLTLQAAADKGLNPTKFLEKNDSNSFFKKAKGEIITGYTETNVNDLQLVLVR
jgi:glycerate-2-kinase